MLPPPAAAHTTVTPFAASKVVVDSGHNTAPTVKLVAHGLIRITGAITGDRAAGTPATGANGVAGATRVLAACAAGPCNDSFRGAGAARLTRNQFAEWFEVSLIQPPPAGRPFAFSMELAVEVGTTWFVATGYISSGMTTARTGQTVDVTLLVDLGTATLPTVKLVDGTLSSCATTTECP
jgi:hypothetical protein